MIKRVYPANDKVLNFKFVQNDVDFIVEEQPIKFSSYGNFLILKIKKQNCDTWELIDRLSKFLGVYSSDIGYAGLKDKRATTIQYISIPKKYQKEIKNFKSKKIEILDTFLHNKKLNIGDLKGNRFKINLHELELEELFHIEKLLKFVSKNGFPNYFGYQRFGKDVKENLEKAKDLLFGDAIIKDSAKVIAIPEIIANNVEANLIHEAAIGKIAGEQLIKLMTLGLNEKEAEEQIIQGFLK